MNEREIKYLVDRFVRKLKNVFNRDVRYSVASSMITRDLKLSILIDDNGGMIQVTEEIPEYMLIDQNIRDFLDVMFQSLLDKITKELFTRPVENYTFNERLDNIYMREMAGNSQISGVNPTHLVIDELGNGNYSNYGGLENGFIGGDGRLNDNDTNDDNFVGDDTSNDTDLYNDRCGI